MLAVADVGQRDQPVEHRGDLEHGIELPGRGLLRSDRLDPQDQVEALVVEVRERVRRVDRQRGEDGIDLAVEVGVEVGDLRLAEVFRLADEDAVLDELGSEVAQPGLVLAGDEVVRQPGNLGHLGQRAEAVGRGVLGLEVVVELGLEAGDADLEELVEVRRRDGQEADLFQQRVRGVAGLFQNAFVEVEPAQLSVDEEAGVGRGDRARSSSPYPRSDALPLRDRASSPRLPVRTA